MPAMTFFTNVFVLGYLSPVSCTPLTSHQDYTATWNIAAGITPYLFNCASLYDSNHSRTGHQPF